MSGGWLGSRRRDRLPSNWRTLRRQVLERDDGRCHLCGAPGADGADHLVAGDDHSLPNLAAVHDKAPPYCHRAKSSREGNDARHRFRERRAGEAHPGLLD